MDKNKTFQCSVVTPEQKTLECRTTFVAFPAHDGEMGVMISRAPLVCKLGIGAMRYETESGTRSLYIDGGFAEVVGNVLTILTEQTWEIGDIDVAAAEQAMVEARAMKITDDASFTDRDNAIKRAQVQLTLARPSA